jgi:hypothetical protein
MDEIRFPAGTRNISLFYGLQTCSGAHNSNGYREVPSPELKRPEPESDHSLASSVEVKNGGAIPPLPHGVVLN